MVDTSIPITSEFLSTSVGDDTELIGHRPDQYWCVSQLFVIRLSLSAEGNSIKNWLTKERKV